MYLSSGCGKSPRQQEITSAEDSRYIKEVSGVVPRQYYAEVETSLHWSVEML